MKNYNPFVNEYTSRVKVTLLGKYEVHNSLGKTLSYHSFEVESLKDKGSHLEALVWKNYQTMVTQNDIITCYSLQYDQMDQNQYSIENFSGALPRIHAIGALNKSTKKSEVLVKNKMDRWILQESGILAESLGQEYAFFHIIDRQGQQISKLFNGENKKDISALNIYHLGLKLLDFYEPLHKAGYTFNDLTLDKIRLGPN